MSCPNSLILLYQCHTICVPYRNGTASFKVMKNVNLNWRLQARIDSLPRFNVKLSNRLIADSVFGHRFIGLC